MKSPGVYLSLSCFRRKGEGEGVIREKERRRVKGNKGRKRLIQRKKGQIKPWWGPSAIGCPQQETDPLPFFLSLPISIHISITPPYHSILNVLPPSCHSILKFSSSAPCWRHPSFMPWELPVWHPSRKHFLSSRLANYAHHKPFMSFNECRKSDEDKSLFGLLMTNIHI